MTAAQRAIIHAAVHALLFSPRVAKRPTQPANARDPLPDAYGGETS